CTIVLERSAPTNPAVAAHANPDLRSFAHARAGARRAVQWMRAPADGAPGSSSARRSAEDPINFMALLRRDIGQVVEAGIPEFIDVQSCLARWKGFERAIGELGNDAFLFEALQRIVHIEVDIDFESVLQILLDCLVHLRQVADIYPLLGKYAV